MISSIGLRCALALLAVMGGLASCEAAPITWIGGAGDWDAVDANWSPADEPDEDDEAIFNTSNVVSLVNPAEIVAGLTMSGGAVLSTNGNALQVVGQAQLSDENTELAVSENTNFAVDDMTIDSGAQLRVQGGVVDSPGGGTIAIGGAGGIYGYGVINAAVDNSGTITAAGGTLTLANAAFMTNPFSSDDELRVVPDSMLEIRGALEDFGAKFNGKISVDGGTLSMNGATIQNSTLYQSVYDLAGGTLMQSGGLGWQMDGFLSTRAGAASTLKGPGTFTLGAMLGVELNADLRLDADTVIHSGIVWSGTGALVVLPGRYLTQEGQLGTVRNEGNFFVAGDPINTTAEFFEQTPTGKLVLDFGGSESDRLTVYQATLAGDLELRLAPGFTPQMGQSFTVLTAVSPTGGYTGAFENVIQPEGMPPDLMFTVTYGATDVLVSVVPRTFAAADFNQDGRVDGDDLNEWKNSFGKDGDSDVDGDGNSDGRDFLAWQQQAGLSGGTVAAIVAEPEILSLTALLVVACQAVHLPLPGRRAPRGPRGANRRAPVPRFVDSPGDGV